MKKPVYCLQIQIRGEKMFTEAHALAGVALGFYLKKFQPELPPGSGKWKNAFYFWALPVAGGLGGSIPDFPHAYQMVLNYWEGIKPLESFIPATTRLATQEAHSLFLWGYLLVGALLAVLRRPESLNLHATRVLAVSGVVCHIFIDILSHGRGRLLYGNRLGDYDDYLFPVHAGVRLSKYFGFWFYRKSTFGLEPKWEEIVFDLVMLGFIYYQGQRQFRVWAQSIEEVSLAESILAES